MIFVFGGAHQGMEDYVRDTLGIADIVALDEEMREIDFASAKAFSGLERYVLGCVRRGESAVDYFKERREAWADKALIGLDFSCGVVPTDAEMRLRREENGRLNNYLAGNAKRVVRLFCGLAQELKA